MTDIIKYHLGYGEYQTYVKGGHDDPFKTTTGVVEFANETIVYLKNGQPHNENGPSSKSASLIQYCIDGKFHNLNGPAITYSFEGYGYHLWYIKGIRINEWSSSFKLNQFSLFETPKCDKHAERWWFEDDQEFMVIDFLHDEYERKIIYIKGLTPDGIRFACILPSMLEFFGEKLSSLSNELSAIYKNQGLI